jgi:ABC-type uncharacterized transport system ATPase subunit
MYGTLVAVDDVSFSVAEGEIFGILGPNGAAKTTAIECAIGLRQPDAGTIRLLGLDPRADRDKIHEIVGVQLQAGALPTKLRVGEILEEYRSFYRDPADVDELLDVLGLSAKRGDYYRSLSGGQRQRLSVALALFPLLFFAGLWLPRAFMPAVPLDISNYTPLGAAVQAIQDSVQTGFPPAAPLLVLAGYTLVFAFLARRFFRWE